jgi:sirohydrochlorin ferrochelatase
VSADLVACAHGTADPRGRRVVHELVRQIARARPGTPISLGFVDVDLPSFASVLSRVVADSNQVAVVPLLLSSGYHVNVDILRTCEGTGAAIAPALGPHPLLADILADRLAGSDLASDAADRRAVDASAAGRSVPLADHLRVDRVVLAAAGSSDVRALDDCEQTAAMLADRIDLPVEVGYLSGRGPRLRDVTRGPGRVAVACYLLAPGFFADRAASIAAAAGAVTCSAPLGADQRIAHLALLRYDQALAQAAPPAPPWRSFVPSSAASA